MNTELCLSESNRVITNTYSGQRYPDHPDRFDCWPQVLCGESVCGRCYWELECSGNRDVFISVSYKSISRKVTGKESGFGYNDHSWSLECSRFSYSFCHSNIVTELPVKSIRIGVIDDNHDDDDDDDDDDFRRTGVYDHDDHYDDYDNNDDDDDDDMIMMISGELE